MPNAAILRSCLFAGVYKLIEKMEPFRNDFLKRQTFPW